MALALAARTFRRAAGTRTPALVEVPVATEVLVPPVVPERVAGCDVVVVARVVVVVGRVVMTGGRVVVVVGGAVVVVVAGAVVGGVVSGTVVGTVVGSVGSVGSMMMSAPTRDAGARPTDNATAPRRVAAPTAKTRRRGRTGRAVPDLDAPGKADPCWCSIAIPPTWSFDRSRSPARRILAAPVDGRHPPREADT